MCETYSSKVVIPEEERSCGFVRCSNAALTVKTTDTPFLCLAYVISEQAVQGMMRCLQKTIVPTTAVEHKYLARMAGRLKIDMSTGEENTHIALPEHSPRGDPAIDHHYLAIAWSFESRPPSSTFNLKYSFMKQQVYHHSLFLTWYGKTLDAKRYGDVILFDKVANRSLDENFELLFQDRCRLRMEPSL